jgi:hypothetical protein
MRTHAHTHRHTIIHTHTHHQHHTHHHTITHTTTLSHSHTHHHTITHTPSPSPPSHTRTHEAHPALTLVRSYTWMATEGDPGFKYHAVAAQVVGILAYRFSTRPVPMINCTAVADAVDQYLVTLTDTLKTNLPGTTVGAAVLDAASALRTTCADFEANLQAAVDAESTEELKTYASQLMSLERSFLKPGQLPNRPYFTHMLQAPDSKNGYAAITLPALMEAALNKNATAFAVAEELFVQVLAEASTVMYTEPAAVPTRDEHIAVVAAVCSVVGVISLGCGVYFSYRAYQRRRQQGTYSAL